MAKEGIVNSEASLNSYIEYLKIQFEKNKYLRVKLSTGKQRTLTQNAALHKFCELLSIALNEGGYDFRLFMKDGYEVPFDEYLVKKHIWKPIQKAMTGKESTAKVEVSDYAKIYEVVNRKMAEYGLHIPWPSRGTQ